MKSQFDQPKCFDSREQFKEWRSAANNYLLRETSTICGDCTQTYEYRMLESGRCERGEWKKVIFGSASVVKKADRSSRIEGKEGGAA